MLQHNFFATDTGKVYSLDFLVLSIASQKFIPNWNSNYARAYIVYS